jgi:hypothetical protein
VTVRLDVVVSEVDVEMEIVELVDGLSVTESDTDPDNAREMLVVLENVCVTVLDAFDGDRVKESISVKVCDLDSEKLIVRAWDSDSLKESCCVCEFDSDGASLTVTVKEPLKVNVEDSVCEKVQVFVGERPEFVFDADDISVTELVFEIVQLSVWGSTDGVKVSVTEDEGDSDGVSDSESDTVGDREGVAYVLVRDSVPVASREAVTEGSTS